MSSAPGPSPNWASAYAAKYKIPDGELSGPWPTSRQEPRQRGLEPKAHLRKAVTVDQIMAAPSSPIRWVVRLLRRE